MESLAFVPLFKRRQIIQRDHGISAVSLSCSPEGPIWLIHTCQPIQFTGIKKIFKKSLFCGNMATLEN